MSTDTNSVINNPKTDLDSNSSQNTNESEKTNSENNKKENPIEPDKILSNDQNDISDRDQTDTSIHTNEHSLTHMDISGDTIEQGNTNNISEQSHLDENNQIINNDNNNQNNPTVSHHNQQDQTTNPQNQQDEDNNMETDNTHGNQHVSPSPTGENALLLERIITDLPTPPTSHNPQAEPDIDPNDQPTQTPEEIHEKSPDVKQWHDLQFHKGTHGRIKKPDEIQDNMPEPPSDSLDDKILDKIAGSMIGMALGDALGAHVEFRPHAYLAAHPVKDLAGGGTWGLQIGQFTDDTSMALCLANSLVACHGFSMYDQLVRYKWWYKHGYMSSTGECFDIGNATRNSIVEFEHRQKEFAKTYSIKLKDIDYFSDKKLLQSFKINCSEDGVAGNGALMRLAPVPLFFYRYPQYAVEYSGLSGVITHGDVRAYDACRYYGALIAAALQGYNKEELLSKDFYSKNRKEWFDDKELHEDIMKIAEGSFKKNGGYEDGIRGKGYIVNALEAALWAFWSDGNSFETGALNAVNLGDDTDTTAAIYGQLAGAYYGYKKLPDKWLEHVYAHNFLLKLSEWIAFEGQNWTKTEETPNEQE